MALDLSFACDRLAKLHIELAALREQRSARQAAEAVAMANGEDMPTQPAQLATDEPQPDTEV
jgi:hypothetical protein